MKRSVKYKFGQKTRPTSTLKRVFAILLPIFLIAVGVYLLVVMNSASQQPLTVEQQAEFVPEQIYDKQLIIPKIAVNTPIYEGDLSVLNKGIWHRFPERGNPVKGGNFILSGHRFVMGRTPGETRQKSYLYNIGKLSEGDEILVDWNKVRHTYKITKVYQVKPDQTEIEKPSEEAKLTLYTCTLLGSADGRVVIEAKPEN